MNRKVINSMTNLPTPDDQVENLETCLCDECKESDPFLDQIDILLRELEKHAEADAAVLIDAGTASQVLHFFHSHEGYPAGGFMAKLYSAMAHADQGNLYRLSQGFPAQVAAMRLAAESPTGLDTLRKIARGGDAK